MPADTPASLTPNVGGGARPRAIALIDGEHYPPVVRAALRDLDSRFEFVAALFLGGREKLREGARLGEEYGLPVRVAAAAPASAAFAPGGAALELRLLLQETAATTVVDLSDEPVLGYRERFLLISAALAGGARYAGADFEFTPQALARLSTKPALAIIGTGKRVGKTAVSGFVARLLRERYAGGVIVLAMGRGGPPRPEVVIGEELAAADLLAVSRQGRHAASDCYEDALLAGVTTIGCRRCGGGMAGAAFDDNVAAAVPLLEQLPAALALLEGSGSVIPPVRAQGTICVASATQPVEYITGYLGTYRMLLSDLLILTMCEAPLADDAQIERLAVAAQGANPQITVVPTVLRPRPTASIRGRRVAFFTTSAQGGLTTLVDHLQQEHGADVVVASADLADRSALADATRRAAREADVFLTEIKAAAIDVVAEAAATSGRELVFCDNEPVAVAAGGLPAADLAGLFAGLADRCLSAYAEGA